MGSGVANVTLSLNGSLYDMMENGSGFWVYQASFVNFTDYFNYKIENASDNSGNYLASSSIEKNITFDHDTIVPDVLNWIYDSTIGGQYGTFRANVSDVWGIIDTVIVNVTTCDCLGASTAIMQYNNTEFINDTIQMDSGQIFFIISVNDTVGNSFSSVEHQGFVPIINHSPIAGNITLIPDPPYSNETLTLTYDFYDEDGDSEGGTEIRWYKNNVLQTTFNDLTQVLSLALIKDDEWNVTVRPKDGRDFGSIVTSQNIIVQNTVPEASNVIVTPSSPITTVNINASYAYYDYDIDLENTSFTYIRWFKNDVEQVSLVNQTQVSYTLTNKSDNWFFMLKVFDGEDYSNWVNSSAITIANSVPSASGLSITSNPYTTDDLVASWSYTDADTDPQNSSWIIRWYKNGIVQPLLNDSTLVLSGNTTKNQNWYFTIQVYDSQDYSILYTSPNVQILNTPPTASNYQLSTNPQTSDNLQASWIYNDIDGDTQSSNWLIRWYKDGSLQLALNDSTTVSSSLTSKGENWYFSLQIFDATDYSVLYTALNITVINSVPTASNLAVTNSPTTLDDLIASWDFIDADSDTENTSWIIHWYQDGSLRSSYDNLTTVPSSATSKIEVWNYTLQVFDGDNYSIIYNSPSSIIVNSIPTVTNPTFNKTSGVTDSDNVEMIYLSSYFDADGDSNNATLLIVYWFKDGVYQSTKDNETILFSFDTGPGNFWYYILKVFDGTDYSQNITSIGIGIGTVDNDPPVAGNLTITANPTTIDNLIASYDYFDNDSHSEAGSEIRWYKNGVLQTQYNDTKTILFIATVKNEKWHFTIRPKDGLEFGNLETSINTTILNTIPTASNTEITVSPKTTNDLNAIWNFADSDGDTEDSNWIIHWYSDGNLQGAYDNLTTVSSIATSKGEVWNYTLQVFDGENYSIIYNSPSTIIINTSPTASDLTLTSNPTTTDNLQASWNYYDIDNDPENNSWTISWYKNGLLESSLNDTKIILAGNTTKNQVWYYTVQVYDGENYSILYTSGNRQILNTAPSASNLQFAPNTPQKGDNLVINYDWADIDIFDSQFGTEVRWYRNNILQSNFNDSTTIEGILIVKGDTWNVTIRASDGLDYDVLVYKTVVIGNTKPQVDTASISPGTVYTISTLVADFSGSDVDSDNTSVFSIIWYNGSNSVPILNNQTEVPSNFTKKGQNWSFIVSIFDGIAWSDQKPSFSKNIQNSVPLVENVSLTGGLTTLGDITISYDFFDLDGDLESGTTIQWLVNSQLVPGITGILLPNSEFKAGDLIIAFITPNDGQNSGSVVLSSSYPNGFKIVGNSLPQILGTPLIEGPNQTFSFSVNTPLYAVYNASDPDGTIDSNTIYDIELSINLVVGAQYRWYKNGVLQNGLTDYFVPISYLSRDDIWFVSVRPRDRYGSFGDWANSSSVLISNSLPLITQFNWNNSFPTVQDILNISYTYFDFDGDIELKTQTFIRWYYDNGTEIVNAQNKSFISLLEFSRGNIIYVTITPNDGINYGGVYQSSSITIINAQPTTFSITVVPFSPFVDEDLIVIWEYFDPDDDLENLSSTIIFWYKNGIHQFNYDDLMLIPSSATTTGESWRVEVMAFDGVAYSLVNTSIGFTIIELYVEYTTNPYFVRENGDITISYTYSDPTISSSFNVLIQWYRNDVPYTGLLVNNNQTVPSNVARIGDRWYAVIIPVENSTLRNSVKSSTIIVEGIPKIHNYGVEFLQDDEGQYIFWVNTTANLVNPVDIDEQINSLFFYITINDSIIITPIPAIFNGTFYTAEFILSNYSLLNSPAQVTIRVSSRVIYNGEVSIIDASQMFIFDLIDHTPPRVKDVYIDYDDILNPTNITFSVQIEEHGAGIAEILLYYYFNEISNETTNENLRFTIRNIDQNGINPEDFQSTSLLFVNESFYTVTLDFSPSTNVQVLYWIDISDNAGNRNPNAKIDEGLDPSRPGGTWIYNPAGIPLEQVIGFIAVIIVIMLIFSFVIIKKFRSKELVGLDIDAVMENIKKLKEKDEDLMKGLDVHTLGIVISFFDQRHGPIPVLFAPEMLRDNYNKLLELSDVSFSTGRFVNDFHQEIQSSFDFEISNSIHINTLSYSFSLNRPKARGGSENIVLNILLYKDVFPLVIQFSGEIAPIVSEIHKKLDIDPNAKENVMKDLIELRKLITQIVLSHIDLYGTIETETDDFLGDY
ncbi:MAG: hypothetical protein ACW98A_00650 [Candidatus Hodarchaeales archaeon]|jgi:hypothetical protein